MSKLQAVILGQHRIDLPEVNNFRYSDCCGSFSIPLPTKHKQDLILDSNSASLYYYTKEGTWEFVNCVFVVDRALEELRVAFLCKNATLPFSITSDETCRFCGRHGVNICTEPPVDVCEKLAAQENTDYE